MCCDIWLVRHGETVDNASRRMQGQLPGKLSELGKKQVQKLAHRLQGERFSHVVVSDLGRAVESFDPLAEFGWSCELSELVREKHCGSMVGKPVGHAAKEALAAGVDPRQFRPPGGESWEDVATRAATFLQNVLERFSRGSEAARNDVHGVPKVLVISHGGFIKEALNVALGQGRDIAKNGFKNASISILRAVPLEIGMVSSRQKLSSPESAAISVIASNTSDEVQINEPSSLACRLDDELSRPLPQISSKIANCSKSEVLRSESAYAIRSELGNLGKRWSFNLTVMNDVLHLCAPSSIESRPAGGSTNVSAFAAIPEPGQRPLKSRPLTQPRPPVQSSTKSSLRQVGASFVSKSHHR